MSATSAAAGADAPYPTKPIKIVSPFSPGGGTDFLARLLAQKLGASLGQTVIVENRPGANGLIGAEAVAKSAPDGYTLLLGTVGTHGINVTAYEKLPYDTIRDFAPISMIGRTPMLVLAHPSVKANTVQQLVAEAKQRDAPFVYSSAGVGSVGHVAGELFASTAGVPMTHAPYRGAAPAVADLVSGQVELMFGTPVSTAQYVSGGRIKVLGVTSAQRSTLVPDIATLAEQGFPGFDVSTWYGLIAPANTPRPILLLIAGKVAQVVADPEVQRQLVAQGLEVVGNTPDEFDAQIRAEVAKWSKVKLSK